MSAEVVTVGFCPQYFSTFEVPGSKGNVYQVILHGTDVAHCTCPAYEYAKGDKTCKHIAKVWEHACLWNPQWKDAGPNDLETLGIRQILHGSQIVLEGHHCPGCGQECVAVRVAV